MIVYWTATPIYRLPALSYAAIGSYNEQQIPLVVESYKAPNKTPRLSPITSAPIVQVDSNLAVSRPGILQGVSELPKLTIGGHMQTPMATAASYATPLLKRGQYAISFADYITMQMEGRGVQSADYQIIDPQWFRDPFGRVFPNPRIINFTAAYVEGVPGRQTFSMTLQLTDEI